MQTLTLTQVFGNNFVHGSLYILSSSDSTFKLTSLSPSSVLPARELGDSSAVARVVEAEADVVEEAVAFNA